MTDVRIPTVLLCSSTPHRLDSLRPLLEQANYQTELLTLPGELPTRSLLKKIDLILVDSPPHQRAIGLDFCEALRPLRQLQYVPILFTTDEPDEMFCAVAYELGIDSHLAYPPTVLDVLAHVKALGRIKSLQDEVVAKSLELARLNRRLQLAYEQIDDELQLARKIQRSFLPQSLPVLPRVRFAVRTEACGGAVSGDFYDILRLDEDRLGFYVADAMGHGVPASLLTIYVKKGIVTHDEASPHRLLPPDEVLGRLNNDLLAQNLSENPFITLAYGQLNMRTGEMRFARAGHPYPIVLRRQGGVEELKSEGTMLGIFETEFECSGTALEVGDRLLFYSDGIDAVQYGDAAQGHPSLMACLHDLQALPIDRLLMEVYDHLFPARQHEDDFTMLGLEMLPPPAGEVGQGGDAKGSDQTEVWPAVAERHVFPSKNH